MIPNIYAKDDRRVTVILTKPQGRVFTFTENNLPDHLSFDELLKQINSSLTEEDFLPILSQIEAFIKYGNGKVTYDEAADALYLNGVELSESLKRRYASMIGSGYDVSPLENFIINLQKNELKDIKEELYAFMEENDLPLTEDGCFLAYKYVDSDYKDNYTHRIDNSVGQKPWMDPKEVDKNRNNTCSTGFHFTSKDYAHNYGPSSGKIMILKVDPSTVMAIPPDYNQQKGRCYTYEVIGEIAKYKEEIKKDFVAKDEPIKEDIVELEESKIKEIPIAKKSSVDYLTYDQATFESREWKVGSYNYRGFKLVEVPAGESWKLCLENAKKKNPELSQLFDLSVKMGIKPGREVANVDRVIMACTERKGNGLSEVLPKANILLPLKSKVEE